MTGLCLLMHRKTFKTQEHDPRQKLEAQKEQAEKTIIHQKYCQASDDTVCIFCFLSKHPVSVSLSVQPKRCTITDNIMLGEKNNLSI